jgi:hypothetical protein
MAAHMREKTEADSVTISRVDADIIRRLMEEFFHRHQLQPEETTALLNLCQAGDFGRPVPETGGNGIREECWLSVTTIGSAYEEELDIAAREVGSLKYRHRRKAFTGMAEKVWLPGPAPTENT